MCLFNVIVLNCCWVVDGIALLPRNAAAEHERDIVRYARRSIEMRDGRVIRDVPVSGRKNAARDLKELDERRAKREAEEAAHGELETVG